MKKGPTIQISKTWQGKIRKTQKHIWKNQKKNKNTYKKEEERTMRVKEWHLTSK
jgi:hypothetical protein